VLTSDYKVLTLSNLCSSQCWEGDNIVSLPDLRTEDVVVLNVWEQWITQMVSMYGMYVTTWPLNGTNFPADE
jgi:hypothetical protein